MIKRWHLVALAGFAGLAIAASMPWTLAERSIERHLLARLSSQFALTGVSARSGAIVFLPVPHLVARDVTVRSADETIMARIPRARADIQMMALLTGRIAFEHLALSAPQIEIRLPDQAPEPLALIISQSFAQLPVLPRVSVVGDGAVFIRSGPGIVSSIRDINVNIAAHVPGEAIQASGTLVWRGEKLSFAFASNSPTRDILPMLRLRSDIVSIDFAASRTLRQQLPAGGSLEGQLQFSTQSMSRLGFWLASRSPVSLPIGMASVSGRLTLTDESAQVSNASLTLGSDVLDGVLDWRKRQSRWLLSGTLAGRNLDIGRPLAGIDMQRMALPEPFATTLLDVEDMLAHDLDLRVSLQRVRLPGLVLSDVAGQLMASDQRLDLSISNAGLYGGVARGRGSMARTVGGVEFRSQVSADRVDLAQLSADLFQTRRLTGIGSFQQTLEASGRTPVELLTQAKGRFAFTARNGEFAGTNLSDAMRRIERQPLSVARDWRGGRTSFEHLSLTGVLAGSMFDITEARGNGPSFRLMLDGQVSLLERLFHLNGQVQSSNGVATVPFEVVGPLDDPSVQVNARAILERSGAAAPLFQPRAD